MSVSPKLSIPSSDCFFSKSLKKISNPPRLTELSGRINVSSCWVFCSSLAAGTWDLMKFVTFFAWSSSLLRWSAYHRDSKDQCRDKFCFGKYNLGGWNYVVVSSPTLSRWIPNSNVTLTRMKCAVAWSRFARFQSLARFRGCHMNIHYGPLKSSVALLYQSKMVTISKVTLQEKWRAYTAELAVWNDGDTVS